MGTELEFTLEEGENNSQDITIYALSTCGFCKRCLAFLRDNSIQFRYVYVDHLPLDVKLEVKTELEEKYKERVSYPFIIIDGNSIIVGFQEEKLKKALGIA